MHRRNYNPGLACGRGEIGSGLKYLRHVHATTLLWLRVVAVWKFVHMYIALDARDCQKCTYQAPSEHARLMELVDMQDLGSCAERCEGSSPSSRTKYSSSSAGQSVMAPAFD